VAAASRIHPFGAPVAFAIDRAVHFAKIRSRAESIGRIFLSQLNKYLAEKYPHIEQVNLVGHSLGARLIVSALLQKAETPAGGVDIGDVLLMGGAVEVDAYKSEMMIRPVKGRLINAFSTSDFILLCNFGERSVGRIEAEGFENYHMSGFGHLDYWPNLNLVLRRTGFSDFSGQHLDDPVMRDAYDLVRADKDLYAVLLQSPPAIVEEFKKHLASSCWISMNKLSLDIAYSLTQRFQTLGGNIFANMVRGRGITYVEVLCALAGHYRLAAAEHHITSVLELEELIVYAAFGAAFSVGHPICRGPISYAAKVSDEQYFKQIDALAEQLSFASYVGLQDKSLVDIVDPNCSMAVTPPLSMINAFSRKPFYSVLGKIYSGASRVGVNLSTSLKPGYTVLILGVAIIFYARVKLESCPGC